MTAIAILALILAMAFSSSAAPKTLEDLSPHLSTNTPIIWQAATNLLPKSFWVYKIIPRVFSETTISNAIVLASFQNKGFPKPSTNSVVLWADSFEGETEPPCFAVTPDIGQMSFTLGDRATQSPEEFLTNGAAVERAWNCLAQLGLDRTQFVKTNAGDYGTYGVFLPRQIDGIQVYNGSEGFQIQYGSHEKVPQFCLLFPNLERAQSGPTASTQQIIACIRAFKTPSLPNGEEDDYFGRIKRLASVKKLTITKITPYYWEGNIWEAPTNNEPPKIVVPIAELEAVADFGTSNATVWLVSPILSSQVSRLLGK